MRIRAGTPTSSGFDYNTDVKGTVKVVSALHPLATSLIQDDPEIYRLRALPITEFLMSRTKYLYNALPDESGQNAARDMQGPAAEVSELAELYQMSREQSPVFRHYALELAGKPRQLNLLMVSDGATFWDKLALYRLTGDKARLAKARSLADAYIKARINTPQRDFSDVHLDAGGQFWSDFAPTLRRTVRAVAGDEGAALSGRRAERARAPMRAMPGISRAFRQAKSLSIAAASRLSACSLPSPMRRAFARPRSRCRRGRCRRSG